MTLWVLSWWLSPAFLSGAVGSPAGPGARSAPWTHLLILGGGSELPEGLCGAAELCPQGQGPRAVHHTWEVLHSSFVSAPWPVAGPGSSPAKDATLPILFLVLCSSCWKATENKPTQFAKPLDVGPVLGPVAWVGQCWPWMQALSGGGGGGASQEDRPGRGCGGRRAGGKSISVARVWPAHWVAWRRACWALAADWPLAGGALGSGQGWPEGPCCRAPRAVRPPLVSWGLCPWLHSCSAVTLGSPLGWLTSVVSIENLFGQAGRGVCSAEGGKAVSVKQARLERQEAQTPSSTHADRGRAPRGCLQGFF